MVQNSRAWIIVWKVLIRVIFFCGAVWLAAYTSGFALDILENNLGYKTPDVIWGGNLVDGFVGLGLSLVFLGSIIFGILGKKVDYFIIFCFIALGFWDFWSTSTVTLNMYLGLIGAAILGNAIGFGLKLLRQKFLPKVTV
jgi:hypothetical protein